MRTEIYNEVLDELDELDPLKHKLLKSSEIMNCGEELS